MQVKEISTKTSAVLFLTLLFFIINSCSNARYTGLKSYRYSASLNERKPILKTEDECEKTPIIERQTTKDTSNTAIVDSSVTRSVVYNKEKEKKLKKPANINEKKTEVEKSDKVLMKSNISIKNYKLYQRPKYDMLTSTFAVNSLMIWATGFFLAGIGSIMHIFLIIGIAMAIVSIIKK